jgi:hypothetical protein
MLLSCELLECGANACFVIANGMQLNFGRVQHCCSGCTVKERSAASSPGSLPQRRCVALPLQLLRGPVVLLLVLLQGSQNHCFMMKSNTTCLQE